MEADSEGRSASGIRLAVGFLQAVLVTDAGGRWQAWALARGSDGLAEDGNSEMR